MAAVSNLDKLREPFPAKLVGKLPRVTCKACSDNKSEKHCPQHKMKTCPACKSWMTEKHTHLDYVGHAEVTRRLLDADPLWRWEPMGFAADGQPARDADGGMWIRLILHDDTGVEVSRIGYGDAQGKRGANATKEVIGDAIRNAAMRFGVALDLWSKERDDYIEEEGQAPAPRVVKPYGDWLAQVVACSTRAELTKTGQEIAAAEMPDDDRAALRAEFTSRMHELKEAG